ncbi:transposase [Streptomyces sp. NPDC059570]|uniref:transposase n=1 Tax=Streptomyces sp. NPDC059570 TaxID=3346870 RepID=UPI00368F2154
MHQVLGETEQAVVRRAVLDHRPCGVGLSGQLWTRRLIGGLIAKLYRARLAEPGVGKYLKRWGCRSSGRTSGPSSRSGYRFSVNAMPAISIRGRMHFMVFTESFTAELMCRFLDRLAGHVDRKAPLAVDRHSAHRSRKVRDWLATHPDDVELHFPPPYSPELHPDEPVNADLKHSLPRQHRAWNQAEPAAETLRFFRRCQQQPHIVRGYFGGPHVRYALDENPMSF